MSELTTLSRRNCATAHLIHGFVGTGKTTYAIRLESELPALRFSLDDWIITLYGQDPPAEKFEDYSHRVSNLIWETASRLLTLGQDVILDFGFWSRASRDEARLRIQAIGAESILYCMTCADDVMKSRVLNRTHRMPEGALYIDENAINIFRTRFEPLDADEPHRLIATDYQTTAATCV